VHWWKPQTLWRELELLLGEALEIEHARIGPVQTALVREFLDHNEFEVAHDQLVDALVNLDIPPTSRSAVLLEEANRLMQLST